MTTSATAPAPHEVDDCRGVLHVYSDGSIIRSSKPSFDVPVDDDGSVLFKDVLFDPAHDLYLRLYKPALSSPAMKLPVLYYIHGGGFCIGSRAWPNCQNYCFNLCSRLNAVIVSPDYRLAPENRLPEGIEDGRRSVEWLNEEGVRNEWIAEVADFERVFIAGDSAGGNIAHNVAVRFGSEEAKKRMLPVVVRGFVLLAPFFGGTVWTRSEAEGPLDAFLNLELIDRFWRLSIPEGETTDHPLINPFGPRSVDLEPVAVGRTLVVVGGSDLLKDRAEDYARRLKVMGKKVDYIEFEGQQHGFFTIDPKGEAANRLMDIIKQFIVENSS